MKSYIQLVFISLILIFVIEANAKQFPKPIQKRIDKAIETTFGIENAEFVEIPNISVGENEFVGIENVSVSSVVLSGKRVGFAGFSSSKGKNDLFDYMVLFDESLHIKKVVVLVYRSSYGGEIMAKYWLKQFEDKSNGKEMEFEKDIDSISGATISAPSITTGIKSLSLLMVKLKEEGRF